MEVKYCDICGGSNGPVVGSVLVRFNDGSVNSTLDLCAMDIEPVMPTKAANLSIPTSIPITAQTTTPGA